MILHMAIQDYLYALGGKSVNTKISAKRLLRQFADWCDDQDITNLAQIKALTIRQYAAYLSSRQLADSSQHTHIRRLKAFLNWCSQEDSYSDLVSERMVKRIAMPGVEQKIITIVAPEVFKRLYDACDERYEGYIQRNRAILCLLIDTGIRVSELCTLTLDCVFFSEDDNFVRVYGKGRKQREVGFGQRTRKALRNYILRYRHASKSEVHVFVSHLDGPLTQSGIDQMLRQLASKAGITMNIHAHLFRHTFAVNYLKAGGDVYKLSRLLGHASVVITEKYLRAFQQRDARQGNISVLDSL